MDRKEILQLLPLLILERICAFTVWEVVKQDYLLYVQSLMGLILVSLSILVYFIHKRTSLYLQGITLIAGTFNIVAFTTSIHWITFIVVPIQPVSLGLLLFFIFVHRKSIKPKLQSIAGLKPPDSEASRARKIEEFKRKFQSLSDEEIERKLQAGLLPEAIEALEQIKIARQEAPPA